MNKLFASLMCALFPFFGSNAFAADAAVPLVCNSAETAKVCRDYDSKKEMKLVGPAGDKFNAALDACAGPKIDFASQRYSDCQDDPEISKLRDATNAENSATRTNFAWLRDRCDPSRAKARVCGTSVANQTTPPKQLAGARKSGSVPNPTLTRVETDKPSAEQIANTRKAAEADRKRKADEAVDMKAKEAAARAKAQERENVARANCTKPEARGSCACMRFFPQDKGTACGK